MKTFKSFLTESLLLEGGKAIKSSVRINQLNVAPTLENIYRNLLPKLGIKQSDTAVLGSTGKKDPEKNGTEEGSSGDIDLGIASGVIMKANNLSDEDELFDFIKDACKDQKEIQVFKGLEVVSIAYPIVNSDGKQADEYCQVDLMPVDDLAYAAWSYDSPGFGESKYKALYPKEFFYACAKVADTKVTDSARDGTDTPITWTRLFFDLNKGLMTGTQTVKGKTKEVTKGAKTSDKKVKSTDPKEIVHILFGPKFSPEDVKTWEQVFEVVNSDDFIHKDKLDEIFKIVKTGLERKKVPVPEELLNKIK